MRVAELRHDSVCGRIVGFPKCSLIFNLKEWQESSVSEHMRGMLYLRSEIRDNDNLVSYRSQTNLRKSRKKQLGLLYK